MSEINNGGPAFPLPVADQECSGRFESGYGGMSLRDYFAAKAMQGLMSIYWEKSGEFSTADELLKCHAEAAYEYADAMLKEREK